MLLFECFLGQISILLSFRPFSHGDFTIPYIFWINHSTHMNYDSMNNSITTKVVKNRYVSPAQRYVELSMDQSFLQSNLEPIDGGDNPEIDW